ACGAPKMSARNARIMEYIFMAAKGIAHRNPADYQNLLPPAEFPRQSGLLAATANGILTTVPMNRLLALTLLLLIGSPDCWCCLRIPARSVEHSCCEPSGADNPGCPMQRPNRDRH